VVKHSANRKSESRLVSKARQRPKRQSHLYAQLPDRAHALIRDPAGTINFWACGLERLYGFTSAEVIGRISHKLLNTEFPCPQKDIDAELFDTGEWTGELTQRKRDGKTIVVASHWVLLRDDKDGPQVAEVSNEVGERARAYLRALLNP
jgi:PAS domain S-box-containing protein